MNGNNYRGQPYSAWQVPSAITETPPCVGSGCMPLTGDLPAPNVNPNLPSLQDIANYNYMSQGQKNMQKEQLRAAGTQVPWLPQTMQMSGGTQPWVGVQQPGVQKGNAAGSTAAELAPITPTTQPAPITGESLQYLNGFLRTQIGRPVRVEFLIGTNTMLDRTGILLAVGANYILINETETDDILACDFYNIKFVRFYY